MTSTPAVGTVVETRSGAQYRVVGTGTTGTKVEARPIKGGAVKWLNVATLRVLTDGGEDTARADAIVKAVTACTHPDATNGAHAYRDGVCRCGAPKRNADGSVPSVSNRRNAMRTRQGTEITEIDPLTAYVATADGMGYGPTATAYVPPTTDAPAMSRHLVHPVQQIDSYPVGNPDGSHLNDLERSILAAVPATGWQLDGKTPVDFTNDPRTPGERAAEWTPARLNHASAVIVWRGEFGIEMGAVRVRRPARAGYPEDTFEASPFPGGWTSVPLSAILLVRHPVTI
jgi:hypothetical protein